MKIIKGGVNNVRLEKKKANRILYENGNTENTVCMYLSYKN